MGGRENREILRWRRPIYDFSGQIFMAVGFILFGVFTSSGDFSRIGLFTGAYAAAASTNDNPASPAGPTDVSTEKFVRPQIVEHPLDATVKKSEPVTFNCQSTGKPQPKILWYKDGELLTTSTDESSSHRVLLPTGALFFLSVQPGGAESERKNQKSDAGIYWCLAKNEYGEARSRNATLRVAYLKEEFRRRPSNVQAEVGQEATLECQAPKGVPEPAISWIKDGRELRLDENDRRRRIVQSAQHQQSGVGNLIITNVDTSDAGFYTCVAANFVDRRESNAARLTIYEKPKFLRLPENVTASVGEDVIIVCRMDGDPPPVVSWRKKVGGGQFVHTSGKLPVGRATPLDGRGLKIENVMASDQGEYECTGKNAAGSVEGSAFLTVYSSPTFTIHPQDRTVEQGSSVSIECDATGNPTPTKFWSREGNHQDPLFPGTSSSDRRLKVSSNGTLQISNVQPSDEGYFLCSALNAIASIIGRMHLKVVAAAAVQQPPPPIIIRGPLNQTLPETSVAILPCAARGRTLPKLEWRKNNVVLEDNVRFTVDTSGALQLHDLRKSDSGTYTCRVFNEDGDDSWSAALNVVAHTVEVSFVRMAEPSTFPWAPGQPQVLNTTDSAVYLEWTSPKQNGESAIIGYRLHYVALQSETRKTTKRWQSATATSGDLALSPSQIRSTRYVARNLWPATSYVFVVRAENQHGIGEPSAFSQLIRTKSAGLDPRDADFDLELARTRLTASQLVHLREAKVINSTAVKLSWRTLQQEPLINGYYVRWQTQDERERSGSLNVPVASATSAIVGGLRPFTMYKFFVRPYYRTVEGTPSNMQDAITAEAAPSMPPTDVQVRLMNLTTLRVSWSPPPRSSLNGELKGYQIVVLGNETQYHRYINTTVRASSVTLFRLRTSMTYRIRVAAYTSAGVGVYHLEDVVTMNEPTLLLHLALEREQNRGSNGSPVWLSWWFYVAIGGGVTVIFIALALLSRRYRCFWQKVMWLKKGGTSYRQSDHRNRFGPPFIKINDGSVAREALWMDHQAQFYTSGSNGANNATMNSYGSRASGDQLAMSSVVVGTMSPNNFAATTFLTGNGANKMDEKRYAELGQGTLMTNGSQFYQPPSTPVYHQVSPPSPTPYATTTLVMNAHRQRLLEQQQRQQQTAAQMFPVTIHRSPKGDYGEQAASSDGMIKRATLRPDNNKNLSANDVSPPSHTDASYVSSGSGSAKTHHRFKQPVLLDFLPPPPAQPPPSAPPSDFSPSSERQTFNYIPSNSTNGYGAGNNDDRRLQKQATKPSGGAALTPRLRLKGKQQFQQRQQQQQPKPKPQPAKQRWGRNNVTDVNAFQSDGEPGPPSYDQAMTYYGGNHSPVSDCTSRQANADDSPRNSFYTNGANGCMDQSESKRSSMMASLATSDDGDDGPMGNGYMVGATTSSCNSEAEDEHESRRAGRSRLMDGDTSEREDEYGDEPEEEEDDDEYETRFLPPAEFTQALASRSLLGSNSSSAVVNGQTAHFRSQPPICGVAASTMMSSQHAGKPANGNYNMGRLNSLPRPCAVANQGRRRGPTDLV